MAHVPIGSKKNRILVCSSADVVSNKSTMTLVRAGLFSGWAYIKPKKGSQFTRDGYTYGQKNEFVTHTITMNYRPDVDITTAAWLYEDRRLSLPRWFKVLNVMETDPREWVFEVRLTEKSETGAVPKENLAEAVEEEKTVGFEVYDDGVEL